jgi:hypothetical protein
MTSWRNGTMTKPVFVDANLTLSEIKVTVRQIRAEIDEIETDSTPVSNEVTLREAVADADRGAEKIKTAKVWADTGQAALLRCRLNVAGERGVDGVDLIGGIDHRLDFLGFERLEPGGEHLGVVLPLCGEAASVDPGTVHNVVLKAIRERMEL